MSAKYTLAVVPARKGSQRIPRKNHMEIEPGLTLTQQAINCARFSGVVDDVIVSSDDEDLIYKNALGCDRPASIAGPTADIADAVKHALERAEQMTGRQYDYVLTLQPAVVARSPLIIKDLVERCCYGACKGAVTAARTVPWQWTAQMGDGHNAWFPNPYPRSQEAKHHLAEVNAVQMAPAAVVRSGKRWDLPLCLVELPTWSVALDIDEPHDLERARAMWPWAKAALETWHPGFHFVQALNGIKAL